MLFCRPCGLYRGLEGDSGQFCTVNGARAPLTGYLPIYRFNAVYAQTYEIQQLCLKLGECAQD